MRPTTVHCGLLVCGLWLALCSPTLAVDPPSLNGGGVSMDLKTQLEVGLRARRPVEFAYIASIVKLVEQGKLPRTLVTSTFGWARTQPTEPLQHFQFALQSRAKNLNVKLPDLANQGVGLNVTGQ